MTRPPGWPVCSEEPKVNPGQSVLVPKSAVLHETTAAEAGQWSRDGMPGTAIGSRSCLPSSGRSIVQQFEDAVKVFVAPEGMVILPEPSD